MVKALVLATCEPNETLAVGADIESAPAVMSKLAGVAAEAGRESSVPAPIVATAATHMATRVLERATMVAAGVRHSFFLVECIICSLGARNSSGS
jgi:hypothetical protein